MPTSSDAKLPLPPQVDASKQFDPAAKVQSVTPTADMHINLNPNVKAGPVQQFQAGTGKFSFGS